MRNKERTREGWEEDRKRERIKENRLMLHMDPFFLSTLICNETCQNAPVCLLQTSICCFHLEKFLTPPVFVHRETKRLFLGECLFLSSSVMRLFEYFFSCSCYFLSLNIDENKKRAYKFYAVIYIQQIFCFSNFFHLQQYLLI